MPFEKNNKNFTRYVTKKDTTYSNYLSLTQRHKHTTGTILSLLKKGSHEEIVFVGFNCHLLTIYSVQ